MTKYTKNASGYYQTNVWDGTYNADGSKHYRKLRSRQSSKDLERKVEEFRREVEERGKVRCYSRSFYD